MDVAEFAQSTHCSVFLGERERERARRIHGNNIYFRPPDIRPMPRKTFSRRVTRNLTIFPASFRDRVSPRRWRRWRKKKEKKEEIVAFASSTRRSSRNRIREEITRYAFNRIGRIERVCDMCRKLRRRWVPFSFFPPLHFLGERTNPFPRTCCAATSTGRARRLSAFPLCLGNRFRWGKRESNEFELHRNLELKFNRGELNDGAGDGETLADSSRDSEIYFLASRLNSMNNAR